MVHGIRVPIRLLGMDIQSYIFLGVGVALSVLGFFLKQTAGKIARNDQRVGQLEIHLAKNKARDEERWGQSQKLLEDRRIDIQKLYDKVGKIG